ncbi:hypothetical protein L9F63_003979, partial [Diploptera punctata]
KLLYIVKDYVFLMFITMSLATSNLYSINQFLQLVILHYTFYIVNIFSLHTTGSSSRGYVDGDHK